MDHVKRTFTARSSNSNTVTSFKKFSIGDSIMDFRLEDVEEALFAYLLTCLGSFQDCTGIIAQNAIPRHWCVCVCKEDVSVQSI